MSYVDIFLIILIVAFAIYAVFGGADFGAGIWDLVPGTDAENRDLIYRAIGPVWEVNHVWLIFILVILFGAFPPAFAAMNSALFIPLFLALVGIVLRGAAYAFRSQLKSQPESSKVWTRSFGMASLFAPCFLGAAIGAIASGKMTFNEQGGFTGSPMTDWINLLSIFAAVLTVGICCYASAVFLMRESRIANQPRLVALWKGRAIFMGVVTGALAMVGLILVATTYDDLWNGLLGRAWWLILISVVAGLGSVFAIVRGSDTLAAGGAILTSSTVILGWGVAQYPDLVPGVWSAAEAASPDSVLKLLLVTILVGSLFLVPAMVLLFRIFKAS